MYSTAAPGTSIVATASNSSPMPTKPTPGEVSLMITRHCLRYSHSLCPKEAKGWVTGVNADAMTLVNGRERLTLRFDCRKCEMHAVGKMKKGRTISITPVAH